MSDALKAKKEASISVSNIGGIDQSTVELEEGVNVIVGRNATNRTSFLQGIMAALGSDDVSIKADAEQAEASLKIGDTTYYRELTQKGDTVTFQGEPYLDDPTVADLFAFLLKSNQAREAVRTGQNLRELIMQPVDVEEINQEIDSLEKEKSKIDDEIERIEELKNNLPELEEQRESITAELEETKNELKQKEEQIDATDADLETKQEQRNELENKLAELRETRNKLDDIHYDISTERQSIESLRQDKSELQNELENLSETPEDDVDHITSKIESLREKRQKLETEINSLQNTIKFNEELLNEDDSTLYKTLSSEGYSTEELVSDKLVCWTCGSEVSRDQITDTVSELQSIRRDKVDEKSALADDLEEYKSKKASIEEHQRRREDCETELSRIENEIEEGENRIQELQERRDELEVKITELEDTIADLESGSFDEIIELHKEANELEQKISRLETKLDDTQQEITDIENQIESKSELTAERDRINEELNDLRTRVETIEKETVDSFNTHMEDLLSVLEYDNIDRIWIERVKKEVREGREKNMKSFFELHVVRSTESGTTYQDTIDHLSESEREVTGLVFALAGYLVHEVHESVPIMLLDSLEAIDSTRIAKLTDYFSEYTDYLVVALLREDANAISYDHNLISSI